MGGRGSSRGISDKGASKLTLGEKRMVERVRRIWYDYLNKK